MFGCLIFMPIRYYYEQFFKVLDISCAGVRVRPADPAGFRGHPGQVDRQLPQGGAHRVDQHAPGVETVTVMR